MKKILLVNPNSKPTVSVGLVSIGTFLKENGYDIFHFTGIPSEFHDAFSGNTFEDFFAVGITATTDVFLRGIEIAKIIKSYNSNIKIIIGGYHPSGRPVETLQENPCLDAVVHGEGEITFLEMSRALEKGNFPTLVPGSIERDSHGGIVQNGKRALAKDLSQFPLPDYGLLDFDIATMPSSFLRLKNQRTRSLHRGSGMYLLYSRGCPFSCVFCGSENIWQRRLRFYDINRILDDIEKNIQRYNLGSISFLDDELLANKNFITSFCNGLIERRINEKIQWACHSRSLSATPEILQLLKRAGCLLVRYGFESGSQKSLDYLKKKTTRVADNLKAVVQTREAGMFSHASFIIGLPDETVDEIIETVKFMLLSGLDSAACFVIVPYPGTEFYDEVLEKKLLSPNLTWDSFRVEGENVYPIVRTNLYTSEQLYHFSKCINDNVSLPLIYGFFTPDNRESQFKKVSRELRRIAQGDFGYRTRIVNRKFRMKAFISDTLDGFFLGTWKNWLSYSPSTVFQKVKRRFS